MTFKVEREIGSKLLSIEVGKIAKLASGSAVVRYGDTVVLGTVVTDKPRPGINFFPLSVDYREKMSAAGKFPGGFFKREGRPTNKEVLTCRMIDRPMRPLFPDGFNDEVQIQVMVLSCDLQNDPDVIGMVSAAAALSVSGIPFNGPVASVRVGRVDGELVINPTREQMESSDMELIIAGHKDGVNMVEVGSRELSEQEVLDAIKFGHAHGVTPICEMLAELQKQAGKPVTWQATDPDAELREKIKSEIWDEMVAAKTDPGKEARRTTVSALCERVVAQYCPVGETDPKCNPQQIKDILEYVQKCVIRHRIVKEGVRSDGRKLDEIRPLSSEISWLPRTHGSSLFTRGETQAMVVTTLGTASDEQVVDEMMQEYSRKFLLHYNFPPFSVGEARRIMGPGRREIGHGTLAERSLEGVLPSPDDFPYTIRLVSDILESNGSSSMATVCGGSLALMDAGVPISGAVAGISVGRMEEDGKAVLFIDILGEEDHFGDMDFKVAGTTKGITGIQLDLKAHGLAWDEIEQTFEIARKGRLQILEHMNATIDKPRDEISDFAPRLLTLKIDPEKIGKVIGPGGKMIRAIQADTGAQIDINDDGTVYIACIDAEGAKRAEAKVLALTEDVEVGRIYEGRVTSIKDFGAFIEIREGQDGLCHISELDDDYVRAVSDVVKVGDEVAVKVISIDDQGRVKLSRKAAKKETATAQ
jgi:polyribonucleotide nucleotidyltransferase